MLGYITLGTNNLPRAAAFYDTLLGAMGARRSFEFERGIAWANGEGTSLGLLTPFDGQPATIGNGVMVALQCAHIADVDRLHSLAISLGAADEGKPGERWPGFYAGYFRDLDGNKLNVFCMQLTS